MRLVLAIIIALFCNVSNAGTLRVNQDGGIAIYTTTSTVVSGNLYSGLLSTLDVQENDRIFYAGHDEQPGDWNFYIGVFPGGNLFAQGGPCRAIQYIATPAIYLELDC